MNNFQFFALTQIVLSLVFGIATLFSTKYLLDKYFKKKYLKDTSSLSYVIFSVALMFSIGLIMSGITTPVVSLIRLIENEPSIVSKLSTFLIYTLSFWGIGILISFISLFITMHIFISLTDEDEFKDISQGKIPSILILSVVIIVISIFVKDSFSLLLESLLPYPEIKGFS